MLQLRTNKTRFRAPSPSRRKLPLPASANVRIAQVSTAYEAFDAAQPFERDRWDELNVFRPSVLVGSAADLLALAELGQRHVLDLRSVDHAVFVLTECGDRPVSDVARVVLWQTFGVPVYELFVARSGILLASECEAHEGWHVDPAVGFSVRDGELIVEGHGRSGARTGLSGAIRIELCACGRRGMRLTNIEALPNAQGRTLAATA